MKPTTALLILATLAGALAVPTDPLYANRKLQRDLGLERIPLSRTPAYVPDIHKALAKARAKYHPSRSFRSGGSANGNGTVTSTPEDYDNAWLTPVSFGTPPQVLTLDFDTGSSDTWVFSPEVEPAEDAWGHTVFDPAKSSSFTKLDGYSWFIAYGDFSSASGDVGTDVVSIGGVGVKTQAVQLAKRVSHSFAHDKSNNGLLGLAFDNINTVRPVKQKTFPTNLAGEGTLPSGSQLFTTALYSTRDAESSFWTFGYIDDELVKASGQAIKWTPVAAESGFWQVDLPRITVGGKETVFDAGNNGIVDSGTTLIIVPTQWLEAFYSAIPGSGKDVDPDSGDVSWWFPNAALDSLPEFKIEIGGTLWTVQPEDLIYDGRDANSTYGALQTIDEDTTILGDTFLKSVYAVWDTENTRIGFVPKIQKTQNLKPTGIGGHP
ncbi:hypothetical protein Q8F55_003906 [Vanrija albida]|uniref:Peptidase A1 domain-containing protein n=1 Tax=Vanrija albida TaxID=181172 RepID=A0ABR3Q5U7_9TREE